MVYDEANDMLKYPDRGTVTYEMARQILQTQMRQFDFFDADVIFEIREGDAVQYFGFVPRFTSLEIAIDIKNNPIEGRASIMADGVVSLRGNFFLTISDRIRPEEVLSFDTINDIAVTHIKSQKGDMAAITNISLRHYIVYDETQNSIKLNLVWYYGVNKSDNTDQFEFDDVNGQSPRKMSSFAIDIQSGKIYEVE